jgi:sec-independent protein translocase protein TatA
MFEGLLQPMHLLVILGIALLVFGPKKLPELGKGLGQGIRDFKSALRSEQEPTDTKTIANKDANVSSSGELAIRAGDEDHCQQE